MTWASKMSRCALWSAPLVLVPAAFAGSLRWLTTISPPITLLVTAAVATFVMGYAYYLGFRILRGLDEVQKAGAAFASHWGASAGQAAFALLLLLPPFKNFAATAVSRVAHPAMGVDGTVVLVSMAVGFGVLVLLQAIGAVVVQAAWWTARR